MHSISRIAVGAALFAGLTVTTHAFAQDAIQAGVSAAVRGDVQVARSDAVGRQVNSGEAIFLDDAITSGSESGMQVLLMDETVFTIGQDSEITIDEFVYDPATGQGSLSANMAKGVMRFVTGNIAAGTPENMTIKLPVGTIGIRGTDGVVAVLTPAQAQQQFPNQASQLGGAPGQPVIFAALNGPGPLSAAGSGTGSFNFSTPNGSIDLNRPGAAVLASPDQPPIFFLAPPGSIQTVTSGLRGQGGSDDDNAAADDGAAEGGDQGGQATDDGGEAGDEPAGGDNASTDESGAGDTASNDPQDGGLGVGGGSSTIRESGSGNDASFGQVTNLAANTETQSSASSIGSEASSPGAQFTQFSDVFTGTGSISTGSINVNSNGISFTYSSTVNFSSRSISAGASSIDDQSIGGGMNAGSFSISGTFDEFSGNAILDLNDVDSFGGNCDSHCTNLQIQFTSPTTQTINLGITPLGSSTETTATQSGMTLQ